MLFFSIHDFIPQFEGRSRSITVAGMRKVDRMEPRTIEGWFSGNGAINGKTVSENKTFYPKYF